MCAVAVTDGHLREASNDDPAYGNYEDAVFYSLPGRRRPGPHSDSGRGDAWVATGHPIETVASATALV